MNWWVSILVGLLMAAFGAVYGGFMANAAVKWLRISSFEGGSGYFVVFLGLAGLMAGLVLGIVVSRFVGGPGLLGFAQAMGVAVSILGGGITLLGGMAWLQAEREPLVAGQPVDLVLELGLPAEIEATVRAQAAQSYLFLYGGSTSRYGELLFDQSRRAEGRWIVPGRAPIHNTSTGRMLGIQLGAVPTQYFDLPLAAKPDLTAQWTDWRTDAFLPDRTAPPPGTGFTLRYKVEHRPPPPPRPPPEPVPPSSEELKAQAFQALPPDASVDALLDLTSLDTPYEIRTAVTARLARRPDLGPALRGRVASEDPVVARDAMYLVGVLAPPPAEVGDAVRAWARRIVAIAEAIDPNAEDSRDLLYERAHVPATGVLAAAHGLRRAGIDIRPELRAMAEATREREKASPRDIAEGSERIIAYFDKLDREGAGK